jgi:hypothetical protein
VAASLEPLGICEHLAIASETRNPWYLLRAAGLVIKQGRVLEVLHGLNCRVFHGPSEIEQRDPSIARVVNHGSRRYRESQPLLLTRDDLLARFSQQFNLALLPKDFAGCRTEAIVQGADYLILGEYFASATKQSHARIACFVDGNFSINDFYQNAPGYCHIHSIYQDRDSGGILVTAGDTRKILDFWTIDGHDFRWVRRMKSRLAGYTAIARLNGTLFFGTDFSFRPNYLETLGGARYFFPDKAYKQWVVTLFPVEDRFLVSVNSPGLYKKMTLSVFDSFRDRFVFCDYLE